MLNTMIFNVKPVKIINIFSIWFEYLCYFFCFLSFYLIIFVCVYKKINVSLVSLLLLL